MPEAPGTELMRVCLVFFIVVLLSFNSFGVDKHSGAKRKARAERDSAKPQLQRAASRREAQADRAQPQEMNARLRIRPEISEIVSWKLPFNWTAWIASRNGETLNRTGFDFRPYYDNHRIEKSDKPKPLFSLAFLPLVQLSQHVAVRKIFFMHHPKLWRSRYKSHQQTDQ